VTKNYKRNAGATPSAGGRLEEHGYTPEDIFGRLLRHGFLSSDAGSVAGICSHRRVRMGAAYVARVQRRMNQLAPGVRQVAGVAPIQGRND
jgi:hypothetical protein